ncbi:ABC transporter ATP-binding protein [Spirillospora sp. CA-255316]
MSRRSLVSAVAHDRGTSGSEPIFQLVDLTAGYGDLEAIRSVSLELHPGEMVAMFGPNGAGKTTTLMASIGAIPRMSGQVLWRGQPAATAPHRAARDGLTFVAEDRSVVASLSTLDNLRLGRGSVDTALRHFPELEGLLKRRAGLLSGGEQQMLALARAIAGRPAALLIDELSLGLAPLVVDRLLAALRIAADEEGVAILLVEQQARRALETSDRWYLLRSGQIVGSGDSDTGIDVLEAAYLSDMSDPTT